ncbi:MAG: LacI family DNA-binding transcriptional regulator [Armatimonadetes bacterium]|nr:LacI family DNA-binding transcriptional regulator [Candidatus Hippobium faecium]
MKKITLSEIAEKLDISVATVSRVINRKTPVTSDLHQKILELAREGGYLQNVWTKNLGNIGLALIGLPDEISNPLEFELGYNVSRFYGRITFGLEKAVNEQGGNLLIKNFSYTPNVFNEIKDFVKNGGLEGLVVSINGMFENIHLFNDIAPTVLINHYQGFVPYVDAVCSNNFGGIKKGFDFLLNHGHTKIGFWKPNYSYYVHDQNRLYSYFTCLNYYGIDYKRIYEDYSDRTDLRPFDRMEIEFRKFLEDKDRPTAILCANDTFAYIICQLAKKYDISIPGDLSIIGFDDLEAVSVTSPAITSVNSNLLKMGRHAIHLLGKRIENPEREHIELTIEPELVIRDTVSKPNKN